MKPLTSRPIMPGYGVLSESKGGGLLDWSWVIERLRRSHDYWVASVTPDSRPHVMPVWGVFVGDRIHLSSGPESRKVRNLRRNSAVVVTTDEAAEPVVVEGTAIEVVEHSEIAAFARAMDEKYETDYGVDFYSVSTTLAVEPTRVFGLDVENFAGSPTRWIFNE